MARARGRLGGRPKALDKKQIAVAESLYEGGKTSVSQICKTLGISRATFYRNISLKAALSSLSLQLDKTYVLLCEKLR